MAPICRSYCIASGPVFWSFPLARIFCFPAFLSPSLSLSFTLYLSALLPFYDREQRICQFVAMTVNRVNGSECFSFGSASFQLGFGRVARVAHVGPNKIYGPPRSSQLVTHLSGHCRSCQRLCIQNAAAIISNANALLSAQGAGQGGVVIAKHVMNCLFGHSINLRLYDAAAAAAASAACASCTIQFRMLPV